MAKKDGARKPGRVNLEQTISAASAADYFEALANALRVGSVHLGDDSEGFRAGVAGDIDLGVSARSGKHRSRIKLSLSFRHELIDAPTDGSAGEPENVPSFDTIDEGSAVEATTVPEHEDLANDADASAETSIGEGDEATKKTETIPDEMSF